MTNQTPNEAAERLRQIYPADAESMLIDAALAEERRHVIEQIRPFMEGVADTLDAGNLVHAADLLREGWRAAVDDLSTPEPLDPAWDKGDEWRSDYSTPEQKR